MCRVFLPPLPRSPLISAPSVPPVFSSRLLICPTVGRDTGRPCGSATATTTRRPILRYERRPKTPQRALCMTCGCPTNGIVISPTRKSSTRVAQGMIHEMALRVPLLLTTRKNVWTANGPCQRMQPCHHWAYPLHHNHLGRRTQNRLRRITRGYSALTCPDRLTNL